MPKDKIKLGIVGCGGIARNRHITGLTQLKRAGLDNFEVTACCDNVEENARGLAQYARETQDANPLIYTDWQELVTKAPVDAVDICLPHGLHHLVGISCLEAGLDVIMEKPYTVTVKTGRELAEAADRAGKVLATAVPHRRMPGQRAVHWAINQGKLIGQPRMFFQDYTQYRQAPAPSQIRPAMAWRRDRMMGGGAMIIDSGFHFLDSILYLFGEVEQVYAELRVMGPDGEPKGGRAIVDDRENAAVVVFSFKNGVVGTWSWAFQVAGKETRNCVIYGSEGSIEDTGYSNRFVVFHQFMGEGELRRLDGSYLSMDDLKGKMRADLGPEGMERLFPKGITDHFAIELWDFLEAVETGRKPEVDGWGGLATTALVEAIYESAISGRAVKMKDIMNGEADHGWQRDIDEYWAAQVPPKLSRG